MAPAKPKRRPTMKAFVPPILSLRQNQQDIFDQILSPPRGEDNLFDLSPEYVKDNLFDLSPGLPKIRKVSDSSVIIKKKKVSKAKPKKPKKKKDNPIRVKLRNIIKDTIGVDIGEVKARNLKPNTKVDLSSPTFKHRQRNLVLAKMKTSYVNTPIRFKPDPKFASTPNPTAEETQPFHFSFSSHNSLNPVFSDNSIESPQFKKSFVTKRLPRKCLQKSIFDQNLTKSTNNSFLNIFKSVRLTSDNPTSPITGASSLREQEEIEPEITNKTVDSLKDHPKNPCTFNDSNHMPTGLDASRSSSHRTHKSNRSQSSGISNENIPQLREGISSLKTPLKNCTLNDSNQISADLDASSNPEHECIPSQNTEISKGNILQFNNNPRFEDPSENTNQVPTNYNGCSLPFSNRKDKFNRSKDSDICNENFKSTSNLENLEYMVEHFLEFCDLDYSKQLQTNDACSLVASSHSEQVSNRSKDTHINRNVPQLSENSSSPRNSLENVKQNALENCSLNESKVPTCLNACSFPSTSNPKEHKCILSQNSETFNDTSNLEDSADLSLNYLGSSNQLPTNNACNLSCTSTHRENASNRSKDTNIFNGNMPQFSKNTSSPENSFENGNQYSQKNCSLNGSNQMPTSLDACCLPSTSNPHEHKYIASQHSKISDVNIPQFNNDISNLEDLADLSLNDLDYSKQLPTKDACSLSYTSSHRERVSNRSKPTDIFNANMSQFSDNTSSPEDSLGNVYQNSVENYSLNDYNQILTSLGACSLSSTSNPQEHKCTASQNSNNSNVNIPQSNDDTPNLEDLADLDLNDLDYSNQLPTNDACSLSCTSSHSKHESNRSKVSDFFNENIPQIALENLDEIEYSNQLPTNFVECSLSYNSSHKESNLSNDSDIFNGNISQFSKNISSPETSLKYLDKNPLEVEDLEKGSNQLPTNFHDYSLSYISNHKESNQSKYSDNSKLKNFEKLNQNSLENYTLNESNHMPTGLDACSLPSVSIPNERRPNRSQDSSISYRNILKFSKDTSHLENICMGPTNNSSQDISNAENLDKNIKCLSNSLANCSLNDSNLLARRTSTSKNVGEKSNLPSSHEFTIPSSYSVIEKTSRVSYFLRSSRAVVPLLDEEEEAKEEKEDFFNEEPTNHIFFPTGKKFRKSFAVFRHLSDTLPIKPIKNEVDNLIGLQNYNKNDSFEMKKQTLSVKRNSILKHYTPTKNANVSKSSSFLLKSFLDLSLNRSVKPDINTFEDEKITDYEKIVLAICENQIAPINFDGYLDKRLYRNARKIGEGVYGEVFLITDESQESVIKIIPIEGNQQVNGGDQKTYAEIFSELLTTSMLSKLRESSDNRTTGFVKLLKSSIVIGKYPRELIDLWIKYDETTTSENENPEIFKDDQLFLVLQLENAGKDLEHYRFSTAKQAVSVFKQAVLSLAAAENALEFEHRDLHWGNILISITKVKKIECSIHGKCYSVETYGVKATIIDYTLSRLTFEGSPVYCDIGKDGDMFIGTGDLQFDIYRHMRTDLDNVWSGYKPYTNIRWLQYLLQKMINSVHYIRKSSKVHQDNLKILKTYSKWIMTCDNAAEVALRL